MFFGKDVRLFFVPIIPFSLFTHFLTPVPDQSLPRGSYAN